jgi:integrase
MGQAGKGVEVRDKSIRIFFITEDGERHKPTLMVNGKPMPPTPANIKYATRLRGEIVQKIALGIFSMVEYFPASGTVARGLTVGTQLDHWLALQDIEPSTKAGYESAIRFWKAAKFLDERGTEIVFGNLGLRAVKHSHILAALKTRKLSGKTTNNYVSVLREAFALALMDKAVGENPVAGIPRAKHQKDPPDPFALDEAEAIIAYSREHHPEAVYNLIENWFFTGYRTSEAFGVKWPSVDFRRGEVLVHEALVRGEEKDTTKTDVSRLVKLNSRALGALKRQKAHTYLANSYVFLDPRYGEPWKEERAFRRSFWTPALKALGIRYRRPYNMRHTYATMMLMAGMKPAWCAKQMGHSIEMFLNTYAKWIDGEEDDRQMDRLENFIAPQPAQKASGT